MSVLDSVVESLEDKVAEKIRVGLEKNLDPDIIARTVLRVVDSHRSEYLTRKDAARWLTAHGYPISAKTLSNMAANNNAGGGPKFTQTNWTTVVYAVLDLDDWRRSRLRQVAARTEQPSHLMRRRTPFVVPV